MKKYISKAIVLMLSISSAHFLYALEGHELIGSPGQLYLYSLCSAGVSSIFSLITLSFSSLGLKYKVVTASLNALMSAALTKTALPFFYGNTRFTKKGEITSILDENGVVIDDVGGWFVAKMPLFGDQVFSDLKQFPRSVAKTVIITNIAVAGATLGSLYYLEKNAL